MPEFSDYIIYLDESGSPALDADKDAFPVFVLACVCVNKSSYCDDLVPKLQRLKFKYFGYDQIIFHERDIRRQSGDFVALRKVKLQRIAACGSHCPSYRLAQTET